MRRRARALALSRRGEHLPWLPWLLLLAALAIATLGAPAAVPAAQGQSDANPPVPGAKSTPDNGTATPPGGVGTTRSAGVLKPKGNPDPGITLPTPNPKEFPTPVIKPPGTQGTNPQVVPK